MYYWYKEFQSEESRAQLRTDASAHRSSLANVVLSALQILPRANNVVPLDTPTMQKGLHHVSIIRSHSANGFVPTRQPSHQKISQPYR